VTDGEAIEVVPYKDETMHETRTRTDRKLIMRPGFFVENPQVAWFLLVGVCFGWFGLPFHATTKDPDIP